MAIPPISPANARNSVYLAPVRNPRSEPLRTAKLRKFLVKVTRVWLSRNPSRNAPRMTAWTPSTAPEMACSRLRLLSIRRNTANPATMAARPSARPRKSTTVSAPERSPSTMWQTPSAPLVPGLLTLFGLNGFNPSARHAFVSGPPEMA